MTLVRVLWLGIAIITGVGFLAYLAAWLVMPSDEYRVPAPATVQAPHTS